MKNNNAARWAVIVLALAVVLESAFLGIHFYREHAGTAGATADPAPAATSASETDDMDFAYDLELSEQFPEALENGEIQVWFQPIIDPATGEVCGTEALSRWIRGEEFISPSVFVMTLEATGQVVDLDRHVFETVCQLQKKRLAGGERIFPISVNLSPISAMQEDAAETYAAIFQEAGIPDGCVRVEVTESLEMDGETLAAVVEAFHGKGFPVEIDDFGAGYASYANLVGTDYDVLKIDKSLTDGIGSPDGELVLDSLITLAHSLEMEVIAEGVETENQVAYLRENGCDAIQGYYYSKPLPPDDYAAFLDERK